MARIVLVLFYLVVFNSKLFTQEYAVILSPSSTLNRMGSNFDSSITKHVVKAIIANHIKHQEFIYGKCKIQRTIQEKQQSYFSTYDNLKYLLSLTYLDDNYYDGQDTIYLFSWQLTYSEFEENSRINEMYNSFGYSVNMGTSFFMNFGTIGLNKFGNKIKHLGGFYELDLNDSFFLRVNISPENMQKFCQYVYPQFEPEEFKFKQSKKRVSIAFKCRHNGMFYKVSWSNKKKPNEFNLRIKNNDLIQKLFQVYGNDFFLKFGVNTNQIE